MSNSGQGVARSVRIGSGQPKIVGNELGLLIGFAIEGSEVNGKPAAKSLAVDFGDISPGKSGAARWLMTCTLSGRFAEFTAACTHSDDLGGRLTSLLASPVTHTLVRDVLVDISGRDTIRTSWRKTATSTGCTSPRTWIRSSRTSRGPQASSRSHGQGQRPATG